MEALDVPYMQIHLNDEKEQVAKEFMFNVFPLQSMINAAFIDVMQFLNWTRCAVIYEKDEVYSTQAGVIMLEKILFMENLDVILKPVDESIYVSTLEELKEKEYYNMLIDIQSKDKMMNFLRAVSWTN